MIPLLGFEFPLREPVPVFAVVLLVLMAAPLAARARVPASVALLVAGIVLGPNALGVLARDETLVLLGTVGLLYIMFLAGLEIDLLEFRRHWRRSLAFGAATFGLPLAVGAAVGHAALGLGGPAAVLLGSVFASHTLLAYPAAQRLGLAKADAVTTSVGATILTDTLALLLLAVIASGARSGGGFDPWVAVRLSALLTALAALAWWGLPRLGAWYFRTVAAEPAADYVFVLAGVFVVALAAEAMGVEAIIGAFLAGLALNRLVPEGSALMSRTAFVGNALFIPFFLLSTGMLVDLQAFASGGRTWGVAGAMVAVVLVTKGAAAWLTRPLFGYTAAEARTVFGLTVPQAAATLAAALVGFEVGLFDGAVLNGTIAMVFVTCLVGPWVVERAGTRLAAAEAQRPDAAALRPRLLVSVSNPATVDPIVDLALLARPPGHEPLHVVTVVPGGAEQGARVAGGERLLGRAVVRAAAAEVTVLPHVRVEHNVARALARVATEVRASSLVLGWDGSSSAQRALFGGITDRVLRDSPAMVLIARAGDRPLPTVRRVVLAVPPLAELEPGFSDAARLVLGMARRLDARVLVAAPEPYAEAVARALGRPARGLPLEPLPLPAWRGLVEALDEALRPDDALVLLSARHGAISWRASLDRLPRVLAQRFPATALLVAYPAQVPFSALLPASLSSGERAFLDRLTPERIHLGLRPQPAPAVFRALLGGELAGPQRESALRALGEAPPDASPELRPGAVLYHVRLPELPEPALFLGVSPEGLALAGTSGPTHVVLVVLVPAHVPPKRYLEWLALVARLFQDARTVDALRESASPEAARAALLAALHPAPDAADAPVDEPEPAGAAS